MADDSSSVVLRGAGSLVGGLSSGEVSSGTGFMECCRGRNFRVLTVLVEEGSQ